MKTSGLLNSLIKKGKKSKRRHRLNVSNICNDVSVKLYWGISLTSTKPPGKELKQWYHFKPIKILASPFKMYWWFSGLCDYSTRRAVTLLRRGADPNVLVNGLGALHTAVGLDSPLNLRFTRLLLDYGGDPDIPSADGLTPIHVAAMWNRVNCLKLLIDRGGNPYQKDNEGMNALKLAKAFEADTSNFLEKLDDRIYKQLQHASFQSVSLDSDSADDLSPPLQSPRVGCSFPVKGLGKGVSMKSVGRKVSRNLRRASSQFRRGIRQIRSLLSSSSSSDRQIKD